MKGDLRPLVASRQPARLPPDLTPIGHAIDQCLDRDTEGLELREQAHLRELAHGMRQQIDADAKRLWIVHRLVYARVKTNSRERKSRRQSRDAPADHCDFHLCHSNAAEAVEPRTRRPDVTKLCRRLLLICSCFAPL